MFEWIATAACELAAGLTLDSANAASIGAPLSGFVLAGHVVRLALESVGIVLPT